VRLDFSIVVTRPFYIQILSGTLSSMALRLGTLCLDSFLQLLRCIFPEFFRTCCSRIVHFWREIVRREIRVIMFVSEFKSKKFLQVVIALSYEL